MFFIHSLATNLTIETTPLCKTPLFHGTIRWYKMVTQNLLRTYKGKKSLLRKKSDSLLLSIKSNALYRSTNRARLLLTCAPISEVPSNMSAMF